MGAAQCKRVPPSQRQPPPRHPLIQHQGGLSTHSSTPCTSSPRHSPHETEAQLTLRRVRHGLFPALPAPCAPAFPQLQGNNPRLVPAQWPEGAGINTHERLRRLHSGETPGLPGPQWRPPLPRPPALARRSGGMEVSHNPEGMMQNSPQNQKPARPKLPQGFER